MFKVGDKLTIYSTRNIIDINGTWYNNPNLIEDVCDCLAEVEITKVNKQSYSIKPVMILGERVVNLKFSNSYNFIEHKTEYNGSKLQDYYIAKPEQVEQLKKEFELYSKIYALDYYTDYQIESSRRQLERFEKEYLEAKEKYEKRKALIDKAIKTNAESIIKDEEYRTEIKKIKGMEVK